MRKRAFGTMLVSAFGAATFFVAALEDSPEMKEAWKIHEKECARCHGDQGKGDGKTSTMLKVKPADWTDADRMNKLTDDELQQIISGGGQAVGKSILMPAFGKKLNAGEIGSLVTLVRSMHAK